MYIFRRIKGLYYQFKYGICNIFKWMPTIWRLRDYDAGFLYLLIHKQLSYTEDCLRNYGISVNSIKYANQIRIAKNLAQRLYTDEYVHNALIPVERKYGNVKWHTEPFKYDASGKPILFSMIFDETPEERKLRSMSYDHAEFMRKQDKQFLFTLLNKKIDYWWD